MALTVTTDKIYEAFYADFNEQKAFVHSTTYSGNPMACAAALEVLNILKEDKILERTEAAYLNKRLTESLGSHKNVGEIRSIGLINAMELVEEKNTKTAFDSKKRVGYQVYQEAMKRGLLLRPMGDVPYFNPPLNITRAEIDKAVAICGESIRAVLGE